ncbi:MAG: amidohydrolase [Candidatus Eremiobacteraeota bacterium]|jgi:4-oxalmesaconate hydratase|nr:amidohydrolase [Candidatus Eremiobacteraeota bacterium]
MIIDSHAHLVTPDVLYANAAVSLAARGGHGRIPVKLSDEDLRVCAERNVAIMDSVGTDVQLISPRPYTLMHSQRPPELVHHWVAANNDAIARSVAMFPSRLRGVAGLPQVSGAPVSVVFDEIDRCVDELGFVGVLLNPDPSEGQGTVPPLGDEYWYPLYRKLVERDLPALIHSASCNNGREYYYEHFASEESLAVTSLARSTVFEDFPGLKLIVSHGGGAIPFQIGRWRAQYAGLSELNKERNTVTFDDRLRRLWFDTCVYTKNPLELLFKEIGAERCLFGTEKPGSGSAPDPLTGRDYDDTRPVIESIEFLTAEQKHAIFEGNARRVFSRLESLVPAGAR